VISDGTLEIAHTAARLIAEEGMAWGPAKQKALRELGLPARTALPASELVEDALREHLALFQADTQPAELRWLREEALRWMGRLVEFGPLLTGAVWRGVANRWSTIHLQLYADDAKAPEIALLNAGERPEPGAPQRDGRGRDVQTLQLWLRPRGAPAGLAGQPVGLHLSVHETVDRRGALLPDAQGRSLRGDAVQLRRLLETN
jgi:hypothetical protein